GNVVREHAADPFRRGHPRRFRLALGRLQLPAGDAHGVRDRLVVGVDPRPAARFHPMTITAYSGAWTFRSIASIAWISATTPSIRSVEAFFEGFKLPAGSLSTLTFPTFHRRTGCPA